MSNIKKSSNEIKYLNNKTNMENEESSNDNYNQDHLNYVNQPSGDSQNHNCVYRDIESLRSSSNYLAQINDNMINNYNNQNSLRNNYNNNHNQINHNSQIDINNSNEGFQTGRSMNNSQYKLAENNSEILKQTRDLLNGILKNKSDENIIPHTTKNKDKNKENELCYQQNNNIDNCLEENDKKLSIDDCINQNIIENKPININENYQIHYDIDIIKRKIQNIENKLSNHIFKLKYNNIFYYFNFH